MMLDKSKWKGLFSVYADAIGNGSGDEIKTCERMIKKLFKDALHQLEWSDREAAENLWTSPRQIRRWMEGAKKAPSAQVMIILKRALEDKENSETQT